MQIERAHEDGRVTFKDGSVVLAGIILHCTGYFHAFSVSSTFLRQLISCRISNVVIYLRHCFSYKYHFPFLRNIGAVKVDDNRVGPLYKHVFPPTLAPGISFVGLPWKVRDFCICSVILG